METEIIKPENTLNTMSIDLIKTKNTGIGARLKATRLSMNLSEKEVAARLYLNPNLIFQIENEDFKNGLPLTFMRGYLRSYAKMLNLPETDLKNTLNQLDAAQPSEPAVTPLLHTKPRQHTERYLKWFTFLIIFILLALVTVWWYSHPHDTSLVMTSKQPPAVVVSSVTATPAPQKITPAETNTPAANTPVFAKPDVSIPLTPNSAAPTDSANNTAENVISPIAKPKHKDHLAISNLKMALPEPTEDN